MIKRITNRQSNLLIIATGGFVLLMFLLSYSETGSPPHLTAQPSGPAYPEFYIAKSYTKRFDKQGQLDSTVGSESIIDIPNTDTARIQMPVMHTYSKGQQRWQITALTGLIYGHGEHLELEQRVTLSSADGSTTMKTPALKIYPKPKQAETDTPVTITSPHGFTRSKGIRADLASKEVFLPSTVRGQYHAIQ